MLSIPQRIHLCKNLLELVGSTQVATTKIKLRSQFITHQLVILAFGKTFHLAEGQNVVGVFVVIKKPVEKFDAWDYHRMQP